MSPAGDRKTQPRVVEYQKTQKSHVQCNSQLPEESTIIRVFKGGNPQSACDTIRGIRNDLISMLDSSWIFRRHVNTRVLAEDLQSCICGGSTTTKRSSPSTTTTTPRTLTTPENIAQSCMSENIKICVVQTAISNNFPWWESHLVCKILDSYRPESQSSSLISSSSGSSTKGTSGSDCSFIRNIGVEMISGTSMEDIRNCVCDVPSTTTRFSSQF